MEDVGFFSPPQLTGPQLPELKANQISSSAVKKKVTAAGNFICVFMCPLVIYEHMQDSEYFYYFYDFTEVFIHFYFSYLPLSNHSHSKVTSVTCSYSVIDQLRAAGFTSHS